MQFLRLCKVCWLKIWNTTSQYKIPNPSTNTYYVHNPKTKYPIPIPTTGSQSHRQFIFKNFFIMDLHTCWLFTISKSQHAPANTNLQIMIRPIGHPSMLKLVIGSANTLILNMWNIDIKLWDGGWCVMLTSINRSWKYQRWDRRCWRVNWNYNVTIKMDQFWIQYWSFWQNWQGGRKVWRVGGSNMDTRGIWSL